MRIFSITQVSNRNLMDILFNYYVCNYITKRIANLMGFVLKKIK